jgi:rod shape-determining protein MreD
MIFVRFAAALLVAYLVQLLGLAVTPHFTGVVDPFLVVLVWFSMRTNPVLAQLFGTGTGFLQDALTGGLFGLHAIADTLVAYGVSLAAQRVVVGQQAVRVLIFVVSAILQQLVLWATIEAMLDQAPQPHFGFVVAKVLVTALLGAILIGLESQARSQFSSWQRRRSRTLRFR